MVSMAIYTEECLWREKNESACMEDPNTQKVKKNTVYQDKTQYANLWGNPLQYATKRHLNNN